MRVKTCVLGMLVVAAGPAIAADADLAADIAELQANANHVWTMTAAALVLLMQLGFLLLEAGMVRSKNSINVAQKNVADFFISVSVFYLFGFGLMFGASSSGWSGSPWALAGFGDVPDWTYTFFVFQCLFVGTATTIMSGAVAERMAFGGYLVMAAVVALVIYPVIGFWAWGNLLNEGNEPWLAGLGFIDFAGSTVVHSVGGWIALAGIIVLGARTGRFDAGGRPRTIHGHSMVLTAAGALVLLVGWIGFNGGSTTSASADIAAIIANTMLAAVFGGAVGMLAGRIYDGIWLPVRSINGLLAGLVGITAGCAVVGPHGAAAIGAIAGLVVIVSEEFILRRLRLDDVVGAVSVHGVCGALGTILVAAFALPEHLAAGSRLSQLYVQSIGVGAAFLWTFALGYAAFKAIDLVSGLRVSTEDELRGLNASEHGASLGSSALQEELHRMIHVDRDLTRRLDDTSGDEAADIAQIVNPFLDEVHTLVRDIGKHAHAVSHTSDSLNELSSIFIEAAGRVADNSTGISTSADDLAGRCGNVVELSARMRGEARRIAEATESIAGDIRRVSDAIGNLSGTVSQVVRSAYDADAVATRASDLAGSAESAMNALAEASHEIGGVIDIIDAIAKQTNLLALNATIEASRAGETGRGFAVVAGEVKALSDRTREATDEIRAHVERIQNGSYGVRDGIVEVRGTIGAVADAMRAIVGVTGQQTGTTREIGALAGTAVGSADRLLEEIRSLTGNIEQVESFTRDVADSVGAARQSASSLREDADASHRNAESVGTKATDMHGVSRELAQVSRRYRVG